MDTRLCIVGIFFDGYYDIWEDFLELFNRNWPDCPYPVYIVDGTKNLDFPKKYEATILHAGEDSEYSKKIQTALKEIDAEYYLVLLEDFFFERPIINDPLKKIIISMDENEISYLRMPMPEFLVGLNTKKYKEDQKSGFLYIPQSDEYTVTCQPSIWKKEFLLQCIGTENYNAWVFEGIYTYSRYAHSNNFLNRCRICLSNPLGLRHGAVQGRLLPNVYEDICKSGYVFKNHREILDEAQYKKHLRKQRLKGLIPQWFQKEIKKVIKGRSVVDRYKDEIKDTMSKMGLE